MLKQRVLNSPYIPHTPTPKQAAFLVLAEQEALYGGQAGGGKSDALLMAALMYVDTPGYAALLLRRTYADLSLPEALMSRAHEWLQGTDARWHDSEKTWSFPSGATITFGYLANEQDKYRYQSAAFQFIGFDELTQFTATQYTYLFSRLRRLANSDVPLRMRAASNPGGIGHAWVYDRFPIGRRAEGRQTGRAFIPAGLDDNPYLDRASYVLAMQELDDITKAQLLGGQWVTDPALKPFKADWWRGQNRWTINPQQSIARFISWDTALKDKEASDYSAVIVAELLADYRLAVREVTKERLEFPALAAKIPAVAERYAHDDKLSAVLIEDKGSGTSALQTLRQSAPAWLAALLQEFTPTVDKLQRARQASVWCSRGCVLLPHPSAASPWLHDFETQLSEFPDVLHDDDIDALTQLILYVEHYLAAGWHARNNPQ